MALPIKLRSAVYKYAASVPALPSAPKPAAPAAPAAPAPAAGAAPKRWAFDRPGSGDAQARAAIYNNIFGESKPQEPRPMPAAPNVRGSNIAFPTVQRGTPVSPTAAQPVPAPKNMALPNMQNSFLGMSPAGTAPALNPQQKPDSPNTSLLNTPGLTLGSPAPASSPVNNGPNLSTLTTGGSAPAAPNVSPAQSAQPQSDAMSRAFAGAPSQGPMGAPPSADMAKAFAGAPSQGPMGAPPAQPQPANEPIPSSVSAWGGAPSQSTPDQQPQQAQTAQTPQQIPDSVKAWGGAPAQGPLSDSKAQESFAADLQKLPPEQAKAKAQETVQAHVAAMPPEQQKGLQDLGAGKKDTPEAQQLQAQIEGPTKEKFVKEELAKQTAANPNLTPQQTGGVMNGIMESWNGMPEPMKWMMGIGLGGGLLGILGSMFGGGGGMGMLGLLGLGAAGAAGAAGGMFGQGAQNMAADAMSGIGKFTGMMPEKLTDQQKQILLAKDPVAHITSGAGGIPTRENAGKQVAAGRQQLGQIQMLNSMGGMTPRMLEGMGLTPEEAQLAAKNVGTLSSQYGDQDSALNQHLRTGEEYSKPTWSSWGKELASIPWRQKTSVEHGRQLALQWAKEARCWKGYEPVPGKKPYSDNSCRPIGSKKKKKKTEKTAEEAADEWLRKFRARGQKGRWVNTRRGTKMEKHVACN